MNTNDTYHSNVKRIGKSGLDLIARSPAHYWAKYLDPNREFEKPSDALMLGSLAHAAVFERDTLAERFGILPNIDKRTKDGKEEWNNFLMFNKGKSFVSQEQWDTSLRMSDALLSHPTASQLICANGVVEQPMEWTMPASNNIMVQCKMKPDKLLNSSVIIDLKTTDNAHPNDFGRSAVKYRYDVQAAWYYDGHHFVTGREPDAFVFICIEKTKPFAISVLYADNNLLELGRKKYQRDLATYAECIKTNQWPAYPIEAQPLTLPQWAYNEY